MQFRDLSNDDLAYVSELGIRAKATWGYPEEVMAVFREELTHGPDLIERSLEAIVACEDETIVGYFTLVRHDVEPDFVVERFVAEPSFVAELDFMFVAPERLRQGIGTAMMNEAVRLARTHRANKLMLIADTHAVGFYAKFGAKQVADHQSSIPGRTIPIMEIVL